MTITLYALAHRLLGKIQERPGGRHHPYVQWAHELAGLGEGQPDETAWCGSSLVPLCVLLGLPIPTHPARARSWLTVGVKVPMNAASRNWDVVILQRGEGAQPGPEKLDAPGHVTIFDAYTDGGQLVGLGGNQRDGWTLAPFLTARILGVRRLWVEE